MKNNWLSRLEVYVQSDRLERDLWFFFWGWVTLAVIIAIAVVKPWESGPTGWIATPIGGIIGVVICYVIMRFIMRK